MTTMKQKAINSLRILALDAIETAKSGHPGLPFSGAPMAYELFSHHLKHSPSHPEWINRDRFVLSAGHGSMLMYSLLHLFGYGLELDELKQFRQLHSKTPGHPEYGHTVGVETTTGPLGAGVATAVGMAMAEAYLAKKFNKENIELIDHHTYSLVGDGCLMEGVSAEALSLAGTLNLHKFIVLYESNNITIEGNTDIAFRENVQARMKAYGFNTWTVEDGNDLEAICKALSEAKADTSAPSFIEVKTIIGYGMPTQGTSKAHSDPMGAEKALQTRRNLSWDNETLFEVDQDVYDHYAALKQQLDQNYTDWIELLKQYEQQYPQDKVLLDQFYNEAIADQLIDDQDFWAIGKDQKMATRVASHKVLNYVKDKVVNLIGGSADLAPSNKTYLDGEGDFTTDDHGGRNLHFGVRENGMGAIMNGLAVHGGLRVYGATFFVFTDYLKPMMRLASLMNLPVTYVMTHDSIGVGEDGPTHQPIEQLSMFRAQPNTVVYRPADITETIAGWYVALTSRTTPTVLALSRQDLPALPGSSKEALKGGYVVSKLSDQPQGVLLASGSEVELAIKAQEALQQEGVLVNVVSMPSMELFLQQPKEYQCSVLPCSVKKRVAIEAGATQSWYQFVGLDGAVIGLDRFGASGPANQVFAELGFTVENVVETFKNLK